MIDIVMTATIRPRVVYETLSSFCENVFLKSEDFRLIINIDPVGENVHPEEVVNVCKSFFKDVVYNVPETANFAKAVMWVWKTSESDVVFHLEDDWLVTSEVDIYSMIGILKKDKSIANLRLSKYDIPDKQVVRLWKAFYTYTGNGYFVTSKNNQFGLNPMLLKREFIQEALPLMSESSNPEKQFRPSSNEKMNKLINKWNYGLFGKPGSKALVVDNGLKWRQKMGFDKPKTSFLTWEKK